MFLRLSVSLHRFPHRARHASARTEPRPWPLPGAGGVRDEPPGLRAGPALHGLPAFHDGPTRPRHGHAVSARSCAVTGGLAVAGDSSSLATSAAGGAQRRSFILSV